MSAAALADRGVELRHQRPGSHRAACPKCAKGKGDAALAVRLDPDGSATWLCHRCGWKGGTRGPERSCRHERAPRPAAPPPEPKVCPTGLPDAAARLWRSCRPIAPGTIAATYFEHRGCALPHPEGDLRWHPALRHPSGHIGPGLVALVTDAVTVEPRTLHRTWLEADGSGKADVDPPRLLWPGLPKAGGVVRLWPDADVTLGLAVGEGIETALALARGFGLAWATIDAGNLENLPVLAGIEAITIAADHDLPDRHGVRRGIQAAQACAERWAAAGCEVRVILPQAEGCDFADEAAA